MSDWVGAYFLPPGNYAFIVLSPTFKKYINETPGPLMPDSLVPLWLFSPVDYYHAPQTLIN